MRTKQGVAFLSCFFQVFVFFAPPESVSVAKWTLYLVAKRRLHTSEFPKTNFEDSRLVAFTLLRITRPVSETKQVNAGHFSNANGPDADPSLKEVSKHRLFNWPELNQVQKLQGSEEVAEKAMSTVRFAVPYVRHEPGVWERLIGSER